MTPAAINARMTPWKDAEFRRFDFRIGLFKRRGMTQGEAESTADRLALRDQERDDRRLCVECSNLRPQLRCATNTNWPIDGALQRCPGFAWERP